MQPGEGLFGVALVDQRRHLVDHDVARAERQLVVGGVLAAHQPCDGAGLGQVAGRAVGLPVPGLQDGELEVEGADHRVVRLGRALLRGEAQHLFDQTEEQPAGGAVAAHPKHRAGLEIGSDDHHQRVVRSGGGPPDALDRGQAEVVVTQLVRQRVRRPVPAGEPAERTRLVAAGAAHGDVRHLGQERGEQRAHLHVRAVLPHLGDLPHLGGQNRQRPGPDVEVVGGVVAEHDAAQFGDDELHLILGLGAVEERLAGESVGADAEGLGEADEGAGRGVAVVPLVLFEGRDADVGCGGEGGDGHVAHPAEFAEALAGGRVAHGAGSCAGGWWPGYDGELSADSYS